MADDSESDSGEDSQGAAPVQTLPDDRPDAALPWTSAVDLLNRYPLICDSRFGDSYGQGEFVRMPDGELVKDTHSPTGYLMGPVGKEQSSEVAVAGQLLGDRTSKLAESSSLAAWAALTYGLGANVGQGGRFDYQREGSRLQGYIQYREYRDVSNFNVGLYAQQAGLSKDDTLAISGAFARALSSNARSNEPYSLDPRTREFIEIGWDKGASGAFNRTAPEPMRVP